LVGKMVDWMAAVSVALLAATMAVCWAVGSAGGLVVEMAEQRAVNWASQTAVRKAVLRVAPLVRWRAAHSAAMLVRSSAVPKVDHSDAQMVALMVDL